MERFTVLIPTLDRCTTLAHVLESCTIQEDENFRILVSDNHSTDGTLEMVENFRRRDPRIEIIQPPSRMGMAAHWTFALGQVQDGFVMVLGADDGLLPDAIQRARACLKEYPATGAIAGSWALYHYPNVPGKDAGVLSFRAHPRVELRDASRWLDMLYASECGPGELPLLYAVAFVRAETLQTIVRRTGSLIQSPTPDFYLSAAVTSCIEDFVFMNQPIALAGISTASNGLLQLSPAGDLTKGADFVHKGEIPWHPSITYAPNWHVILGEAMLRVKEVGLVPKDKPIAWDRIIAHAVREFHDQGWPPDVLRANLVTLQALSRQTGCSALFDGADYSRGSSVWQIINSLCSTWKGDPMDVRIDTRECGVHGIHEAAKLAGLCLNAAARQAPLKCFVDASPEDLLAKYVANQLNESRCLRDEVEKLRGLLQQTKERSKERGGKVQTLKTKLQEARKKLEASERARRTWWVPKWLRR